MVRGQAALAALFLAVSVPASAQSFAGVELDPDFNRDLKAMLDNGPTVAGRAYTAITQLCPGILKGAENKVVSSQVAEAGFTERMAPEEVPGIGLFRQIVAKVDDGAAILAAIDDRSLCAVMLKGEGADHAFSSIRKTVPVMLEVARDFPELTAEMAKRGVDFTRYAVTLDENTFYVLDFVDTRQSNPTGNLTIQARIETIDSGQ